jgi:hypothetical protein
VLEDGSRNPMHLKALERAVEWLVSIVEKDGSWQQGAYVQDYIPSYYTRAIWGVLRANQILQRIDIESIMRHSIDYYAHRIQPNGAVDNWGFWPDQPAFTHTIAYTLEGFAETAILLKDNALLLKTQFIADELATVYATHGRTAGSYDTRWQGDYSFICPTGNAQLSSFFLKMAHFTGNTAYTSISLRFLSEILPFQVMQPPFYLRSAKGAIPGSAPFWGAYQRFRYPNWGVKFLLDALWHLKPI